MVNFLVQIKENSGNNRFAASFHHLHYTDIDLLLNQNNLVDENNDNLNYENDADELSNKSIELERKDSKDTIIITPRRSYKSLDSSNAFDNIPHRITTSEAFKLPGIALLPEPDFNRLLHFSKMIKEECPFNQDQIGEDTTKRLILEAQMLREIEPFYISTEITDKNKKNELDFKKSLDLYSNQNYIEESLLKCEKLLYEK